MCSIRNIPCAHNVSDIWWKSFLAIESSTLSRCRGKWPVPVWWAGSDSKEGEAVLEKDSITVSLGARRIPGVGVDDENESAVTRSSAEALSHARSNESLFRGKKKHWKSISGTLIVLHLVKHDKIFRQSMIQLCLSIHDDTHCSVLARPPQEDPLASQLINISARFLNHSRERPSLIRS